MKLKLPSFGGSTQAPAGTPAPEGLGEATSEPVAAASATTLNTRALLGFAKTAAIWGSVLTVVFFVTAWICLPTKAIAWRIGHEARTHGMMISVDDVGLRPWGKVKLYDTVWSFRPARADEISIPFVVETLDVKVSLISYLFGEYDIRADGTLDEGHISGRFVRSENHTSVQAKIVDLPLYSVPKLQQAMNAPLSGTFELDADLDVPENKFSKANGSLHLVCNGCTIGDGESKLYVPGVQTGMLAKGVTTPVIDIGSLEANMTVENGVAVAEEFGTKSDDIQIKVSGQIEFRDPIQQSRLDLVIKVYIAEHVIESDDNIRLMVSTATKAKMDPPEEGWLGFKLQGSLGRPKFRGIKQKSREERLRERREKSAKRAAERREKSAERKKEREDAKRKREEAAANGGSAGGSEPSTESSRPDPVESSGREVISPTIAEAIQREADEGGDNDENENEEEEAEGEEDEEEDDDDEKGNDEDEDETDEKDEKDEKSTDEDD